MNDSFLGKTLTAYIANIFTIRDLSYDDYLDYISKYGRHGTLHRTKRKSPREFVKQKYGQR